MIGSTVWDENLSYKISAAISNYELERTTGRSFGTDEIKANIGRSIPSGNNFKAYPIYIQTLNYDNILNSIISDINIKEMIDYNHTTVRFGLRTKIICYSAQFVGVWAMLCTCYSYLN